MLEAALYAVAGLILLYFGASSLVKGSASLALRVGVSPLVVGLTVVAFATSTPELFVALKASLADREGISVGNIIGANMLNVGVILGVTALITPLKVEFQLIRIDVPIMIAAAAALMLAAVDGKIGKIDGALFLLALAGYLVFSIVMARREHNRRVLAEYREEAPDVSKRIAADAGFIALGVVLLAGLVAYTVFTIREGRLRNGAESRESSRWRSPPPRPCSCPRSSGSSISATASLRAPSADSGIPLKLALA